ncbi:hypothetical protein C1752_08645 [Acaryochloris thomasi RCC1774]|uniref:Uncharacterized protein n=1 Tax=Acaryochloris thomasi RCC1774 TaxID=1764569 RepID=A0A2W1JIW3_9CYAN|nr:hypothetical protein C1752_08645 [Acaryochloris thomasi RCC1774]
MQIAYIPIEVGKFIHSKSNIFSEPNIGTGIDFFEFLCNSLYCSA